ncbi:MAG: hypothetical protein GY778_05685, partial [bacterium]|nr:hypothetical protein [bacterium]
EFVAQAFESAKQQALLTVPDLVNFSTAEVVVWAGLDGIEAEPRVALQFVADNFGPGGASNQKRLYVADVQTGDILHHESAILDVDGNASGMVTHGSGADFCEPEALTAMPHLRITSGANSAVTDANGDFTITAGGGTVDATLADGVWFDIRDFVTGVESVSVSASTPANLVFNAVNSSELIRAQSNAYAGANDVRDFAAQFNPTYPTFTDTDISCWTNRTDGFCPGNAWYDPSDGGSPTGYSINFCQSGGGFPNTAWTSVIYHEFGHHLVNAGGSGQGQYGEGMGDVMSVIMLDDNRVGLGFFGTCDLAGTLRNADNTLQYPCSGAIHFCGQLISGCVWDTRNQLVLTEPANYTNILGNLAVNAILVHSGDLITPQITIDWLTLDDTDGNIGNGTPHYSEICTGFGAHSMDCPPLDVGMSVGPSGAFNASGDPGGPFAPDSMIYTVENLGPGGISYDVTTAANWLTITNGSGTLPNVNDTAQVTVTINANANTLPVGRHEASVNFNNTTNGIGDTVRFVSLSIGIPDDCAAAIELCPGTVSDSTVDMTNDGSASCGTSNSTPDMWYSYTPDSNGTATFSLCSGTAYDAVLSVHTGCPGTTANEVGCDDDGCGSTGGPSIVTISVTAGTEYLVRVTGWDGSTGAFTLTITGPNCASNVLDISFPSGLREALAPGVPTNFDVQIVDGDETYVPGTGTLHYRYDGGSYQTAALTAQGGNLYQATLPAAACGDTPEFYVSAQGHLGTTVTNPFDAPSTVYSAVVGTLTTVMDDNFETNQGWVATNTGASSGDWQRGVPVNDPSWEYDPTSDSDGSGQCYLTQNQLGNTDVDGHNVAVILTSPSMDMSAGGITISYDYYLRLTDITGGVDKLLVEINENGGAGAWTEIARHDTDGGLGWRSHVITQADLDSASVTLTANMQMRYSANDNDPQSINESGLDAFKVTAFECTAAQTCSDGILNQREHRIDCGGPCPACECTSDGACTNGAFCDGAETCDAFGDCQNGTDPCPGQDCDEGSDVCVAATIVAARSCMMHVGQRWCLDLAGGVSEPRWNPAQLELDLSDSVSSVSASMSCASGHIGAPTVSIGAGPNGPQSRLTVDLNPLPTSDCCTLTLSGDALDQYQIIALAGDVNGSGMVNATDKNLVKGSINKPVDAARFLMDVNTSNAINTTDKNLTKGWIGGAAVVCP